MVVADELVRKMVAEAIGTFVLVFVGTASIITAFGGSDAASTINYALGFGFALVAIVYALGHVSGAHVNPAVTLGLALTGRFPMAYVPYYWTSQLIGALVASLLVRLIFGNVAGLGATRVFEGFSVVDGFVLELILAAILVFVIQALSTDEGSPNAGSGLAIGGALLVIQLVGGPVSGGSVNPARSLAPSLVSGSFDDLWIYLTAPFIGAIIGSIAYEFVRHGADNVIPERGGTPPAPNRGRGRWDRDEQGRQRRPERATRSGGAERDRQRRQQRSDRFEREQWQGGEGAVRQRRGQQEPVEQEFDADFEEEFDDVAETGLPERTDATMPERPGREREPRRSRVPRETAGQRPEPRADEGSDQQRRPPRQRQRRPPEEFPEE